MPAATLASPARIFLVIGAPGLAALALQSPGLDPP